MLEASHNIFLYHFFILYSRLRMKVSFREVVIDGELTDRGLPVLVVANHFSWWDGFWVMHMNMKMFGRKFWFMMLEEQLMKYRFFNKTGGYSVKKGSRSVIKTVSYTIKLLGDRNNMVLVFPQGKLESNYIHDFKFEKGIERIVNAVSGKIQVVFMLNLVEYYSGPRPSLYMYLGEYSGTGGLEKAYNDFYRSSVNRHLEMNIPE